jgi:hypothetical protein
MMSVVKVGDVIRPTANVHDVSSNKTYVVREVQNNDVVWVYDDKDEYYPLWGREYVLAYDVSPNDTVRLKSGEPFTDGSYTAEVDSTKGDIVLLKIGSWLPVEAVEKVEAWVPEGTSGWIEYRGGGNPAPGAKVQWLLLEERKDREFFPMEATSDALLWSDQFVAYRIVEPAPVPAAEPAAETKPKFKVGDRVRYTGADPDVHDTSRIGAVGRITAIEADGSIEAEWDDGIGWPRGPLLSNLELVGPTPTTLNVTLSVGASFRDLSDQFQRIADTLRAA